MVDDDDHVRKFIVLVLHDHGYRTLAASNGDDGLRLFREHASVVDLVLSDLEMPRLSGAELAPQILALKPSVQLAFITGMTSTPLPRDLASIPVLHKPFTATALAAFVSERLGTSH